jgi:hypothetical protein
VESSKSKLCSCLYESALSLNRNSLAKTTFTSQLQDVKSAMPSISNPCRKDFYHLVLANPLLCVTAVGHDSRFPPTKLGRNNDPERLPDCPTLIQHHNSRYTNPIERIECSVAHRAEPRLDHNWNRRGSCVSYTVQGTSRNCKQEAS